MSSIGLLLAWCPGVDSPCDPCKKKPPSQPPGQPPSHPPGYPNWGALAYDGTADIRLLYQAPQQIGIMTLWGGHTFTFGPHALPDPGYWFEPPYVPPGAADTNVYTTTVTVYISTQSANLPSAPMSGTDIASVQAADQAAQWQAFNYAVAHPPI